MCGRHLKKTMIIINPNRYLTNVLRRMRANFANLNPIKNKITIKAIAVLCPLFNNKIHFQCESSIWILSKYALTIQKHKTPNELNAVLKKLVFDMACSILPHVTMIILTMMIRGDKVIFIFAFRACQCTAWGRLCMCVFSRVYVFSHYERRPRASSNFENILISLHFYWQLIQTDRPYYSIEHAVIILNKQRKFASFVFAIIFKQFSILLWYEIQNIVEMPSNQNSDTRNECHRIKMETRMAQTIVRSNSEKQNNKLTVTVLQIERTRRCVRAR